MPLGQDPAYETESKRHDMLRPQVSLRVVLVLVIVCAAGSWGIRAWLDPFRTYPKSDAFDHVLRWQSSRLGEGREDVILKITTFPTGTPETAEQCQLSRSGRLTRWTHQFDWAYQHTRTSKKDDLEMAAIKDAIVRMPPSESSPPMATMLFVSFVSKKTWTTRIYDRATLPLAVKQLCRHIDFQVP